jgi:hypothetical protein
VSNQELVDAYIEGRISRRVFIRRMVLGGISLSAAAAYAGALAPGAKAGEKKPKHYPKPPKPPKK